MANTVFLPSYSIGGDAYKEIANICAPYGTKAVVIGGKTAISKAKQAPMWKLPISSGMAEIPHTPI